MSNGTNVNSGELCCAPIGESALTQDDAEEIATKLKALADPIRLRLVSMIAQSGEVCACDLPAALGRAQPTVSHHLKVLVEAGLLDRDKRGKWAWFTVRADQLEALGELFKVDQPV